MRSCYTMKISRLMVEKLGVKLYDRISAVIAELVANSYDADATEVKITAPLGTCLATKTGGQITDRGLTISVCDNGVGMTPDEINKFYLRVGAERRNDPARPGKGNRSPKFKRHVMGRKGVGKLAPFGICNIIEILSSGGEKIKIPDDSRQQETGYRTAHLILDRQKILEDTDHDYHPRTGALDNTLQPSTGTTVTLRGFAYRRVPDRDIFTRQLAQRFGLTAQDWELWLCDANQDPDTEGYKSVIGSLEIKTMAHTRIHFQSPSGTHKPMTDPGTCKVIGPDDKPLPDMEAGFEHDGRFYPVTGWTAYARHPFRDDLMAGVRIYCRGKIAAQTGVFNSGAGFTGEYNVRSYLVGELYADWLDDEEDLIQTDRRDILWSHELGQALQEWGQKLVRTMGRLTREPMRKQTLDLFLEASRVDQRIQDAFPLEEQEAIRDNATKLARGLGRTMRADEVQDGEVVEHWVNLILILAPQLALGKTMQEAGAEETPVGTLVRILHLARLAELSSLGQIAETRLNIIQKVQNLKDDSGTAEQQLQDLLAYAPWLINPQWSLIAANQTFASLAREFPKFYRERTGQALQLGTFQETRKRPDFVLFSVADGLQLVEIKRPGHKLQDEEMARIMDYHDAMQGFLAEPAHKDFRQAFPAFHITLICDGLNLKNPWQTLYDTYGEQGKLTRLNWTAFLLRTEQTHQSFLAEAKKQRQYADVSA